MHKKSNSKADEVWPYRAAVTNGRKCGPTEGKGICKSSFLGIELLPADPHTLRIKPSRDSNKSREQNNQGEKHNAHDTKEKDEIDSKHPVQVQRKLLVGVDSHSRSCFTSRASEQATARGDESPHSLLFSSSGSREPILHGLSTACFLITRFCFSCRRITADKEILAALPNTLIPRHGSDFVLMTDLKIL